MDLMLIAKAVGALSVMGVVVGVMLTVASQKFHVEVDPRVEAVFAALPGSNCGACGHPSCFAVAESMVTGASPIDACIAGGQTVVDAVALALGQESCAVDAIVSARHCCGGLAVRRVYEFSGVKSCAASHRLAGGVIECSAGCLGLGDCMRACPFDAIRMDDRSLPVIDLVACTGCGVCVRECPRGHSALLEMVGEAAPVVVRCVQHDKPAQRKKYCPTCCIACKKCEKECPEDAIHVVDWLAVVDYGKCTGCGACVDVCPQDCIDFSGRSAVAPAHTLDGMAANVPGRVAAPKAEQTEEVVAG